MVKEAVAKATGLGFTLPPSGIEVDGDGPALDVRLGGPWAAYSSVPWAAQLVAEDDRRLAAVAADHNWTRTKARNWGETADGRQLFCVYEYLDDLTILPVTAYQVPG